ncbi:MAG: hypothetical protein EXX96DRAFT_457321, partial [Benjaminiella poitrasii]
EEQPIRTFSSSFFPLLRLDLPYDIKATFIDILKQATLLSSNYIAAYSVQLYKIVLLLKNYSSIHQEGGLITMQQSICTDIQQILSENFPLQCNIVYLPPPIVTRYVTDAALPKEYDKLFNNLHLQFIHSTYFGPRGSTEASRSKHPFQKSLLDALPSTVKTIDPVDPYVMKMPLSKYMTNFQNIWSNKKRFSKMLSYVIIVLLLIHLAPERERIKRERIAN